MLTAKRNKIACVFFTLILLSVFTAGCAKSGVSAKIEIEKPEVTGNNIVEIPHFTVTNGESTRAIDKLNKETKFLEDLYEGTAEKQDGSYVEIKSYPLDTERFLQVTTIYRVVPSEMSTGDLMTLAYDTKTDTAITPEDALKQSGITGDQLSTKVHAAFVASGMPGEVTSTEMQGFELAEDGSLSAVYMKLGIFDRDTDEMSEIFCLYSPEDESLSIKNFGEGMDGGD